MHNIEELSSIAQQVPPTMQGTSEKKGDHQIQQLLLDPFHTEAFFRAFGLKIAPEKRLPCSLGALSHRGDALAGHLKNFCKQHLWSGEMNGQRLCGSF